LKQSWSPLCRPVPPQHLHHPAVFAQRG
jgi:hypothetical protein